MVFSHTSVLLKECLEGLNIKPNGIYVDGTAGGAGHSIEIARRLGEKGLLIAIDQDDEAIAICKERLSEFSNKVKIVKSNFENTDMVLKDLNIEYIDGFLADLGVSSYQLDNKERGFSYTKEAPLDMRMNSLAPISAMEIVNKYSYEELKKIFWEYGEEKFSSKIANKIIYERQRKKIETTTELADIIKSAMPSSARAENQHPAKRTFQAIRIAVNDEMGVLTRLLKNIITLMRNDGRIEIITFHSLEDRIVKNAFKELAKGCICPKDFPICVCNNKPLVEIITRKPILPSDEEIASNPRARSAKLRIARVI